MPAHEQGEQADDDAPCHHDGEPGDEREPGRGLRVEVCPQPPGEAVPPFQAVRCDRRDVGRCGVEVRAAEEEQRGETTEQQRRREEGDDDDQGSASV